MYIRRMLADDLKISSDEDDTQRVGQSQPFQSSSTSKMFLTLIVAIFLLVFFYAAAVDDQFLFLCPQRPFMSQLPGTDTGTPTDFSFNDLHWYFGFRNQFYCMCNTAPLGSVPPLSRL